MMLQFNSAVQKYQIEQWLNNEDLKNIKTPYIVY